MAAASDIISKASTKVGVASPTATQNAEALASLNDMIAFWGTENLHFVVTSETLSIGTSTATYTIGSGGNLNTVRPVGIEKCFLKDANGYDWPVDLMSSDRYNRLDYKPTVARPTKLYYLPEFPLAKVIFETVPDAAYTAYFEFKKGFSAFASTTATLGATFPSEYYEALVYNLAVAIAENWDRKIPPTVMMRAQETKTAIESMNAANRPVPDAKFDLFDSGSRNITTDT